MGKEISDHERELFRNSIGYIQPIRHDKISIKKSPKKLIHSKPEIKPILKRDFHHTSEQLGFDDHLAFTRHGVQPQQLKRLRQGKLYCEAECDLHGLSTQQAEEYLEHFIADALKHSLRCIRIVHGKGFRSERGHPVLKNMVNYFLQQLPDVLAFYSSQPKDGGLGAAYVLLRSQK
jgi:DNA-nicking Smr family endonuclease